MASDYLAIHAENQRRYGTDIARIGAMLLSGLYADRTHFIFELLQNAEDALRKHRRPGSRAVSFDLTDTKLRVSHFGQPFDEGDVRSICGIAESRKDLTSIGHFGIGFKSVYAFTDRPEIHSGREDFAIEAYVHPVSARPIQRDEEETVILVPLKRADATAGRDISHGLARLDPSTLLFLREIEEIRWGVRDGRKGIYRRESRQLAPGVRRVVVIGQHQGEKAIEEGWLIFSRPISDDTGRQVGNVEVAFSLIGGSKRSRLDIQPVAKSLLVVFFPTMIDTRLGFLVQGPYRTTPPRDNVPPDEAWNRRLVVETAALQVAALRWLRDRSLLNAAVLQCLPLDPEQFGDEQLFAPLFGEARSALRSEPLLPRLDAGYVTAPQAILGSSQDLRTLFTSQQLAMLYGDGQEPSWLSAEINQTRTPDLRQYLLRELEVAEVSPETIIQRLTRTFLEAQPDDWIRQLYEFLGKQPKLRGRFDDIPIIRLENGAMVRPKANGQTIAFLPGAQRTDFPTVRAAVCVTDSAREFLEELGLTEPDLVDDVIRNLLPKYRTDLRKVNDHNYEKDIRRILAASATESRGQLERLTTALREVAFVKAVDAGTGAKRWAKAGEVYLATDRLKGLFAGIEGVLLVDDESPCLRGEQTRQLLEACGATRYLRPVPCDSRFTWRDLRQMRVKAGCESSTGADVVEDKTLQGLDPLLESFGRLDSDSRSSRSALLWEALGELQERRGTGVFTGTYKWFYYQPRSSSFDAAFVRRLNETAWVPGSNGELQVPQFVLFESLKWDSNSFLESKIQFKQPIIDQLARAAGIEPGVLDLLSKLGLTSEAELRARLKVDEEVVSNSGVPVLGVDQAVTSLGITHPPTSPILPTAPAEVDSFGEVGQESSAAVGTRAHGEGSYHSASADGGPESERKQAGHERKPGSAAGRQFISYVAAHADGGPPDSDGLDHQARMALEARAIDIILRVEKQWHRTPAFNPGFDLFQVGPDGTPIRWCEVKAMTGDLNDRAVGLSRAQFDSASEHGDDYWLYIVEHAAGENARIVRIQNPAGKALTFTFDHGWLAVAQVDLDSQDRKD